LRHYRRGGWAARVSRDSYLWQGEERVRCLVEFDLLRKLRAAGLPVPAPIAACYRRQDLRYQASIIVERIAGARSFVDAIREAGAGAPWAAVGTAVGRCHRHRVHHADLNANNILLAPDQTVHLIDWDKGRIEVSAGRWRRRVLDRLQRSLRKECQDLSTAELTRGMQILLAAHNRELIA
jgi:3-deoxy-D-manno-octulosonic acid kinase